jgi:TolB-like protein
MRGLFDELKHRNVFRVGVAYVIAGWLVAQVADLAGDAFGAPAWVMQMLIVLLLIGLPIAVFLAWAYELTSDGVKKAKDLPADMPKDPRSGRVLNRVTILGLLIAVAWLGWDKLEGPTTIETVSDKSIAVLPFADFSPDGGEGWFADGLTDEILNALARASDLRVASRTSSFRYRATDRDVPKIASELGVAHILEGSVRRAGDRLRVTAQLIRAADDVHLWSDTFDGSSEDSITIQETIALKIAQALETAMDPDELQRMISAGTSSVEAWELYLRAEALNNSSASSASDALRLLEQAVAVDPEFVDAHIEIAAFWFAALNPAQSIKYDAPITREEARQRFYASMANAERYARSEVTRAESQSLRARFDIHLFDYIDALKRIVAARPESASAAAELMSGYILVGDYEAARQEGLRAKALSESTTEPGDNVYQYLHRVDLGAALEMVQADLRRANLSSSTLYQAHRVLLYAGRVEEAARVAKLHNDRTSDASTVAMVNLRQACAEGRTDDAEAIYAAFGSLEFGGLVDNRWLLLRTIGHDEEATEAIRHLDDDDGLFALSGFLHYTHFDPTPFPNLMATLESQGIKRPPPTPIPFACRR